MSQEDGRNVVAEAVFAGEKIEELPLDNPAAILASGNAPFARFPKDFFMGDSPGDRCDRYRQDHQKDELTLEIHSTPRLDRHFVQRLERLE